jgi:hypothetical protein
VKFRPVRPVRLLAAALLAAVAVLLAVEFNWRARYGLAKPPAPSPDGAYVAEVRKLPDARPPAPRGTGVFLRGEWAWLRSLQPRLVFAGECDDVSTRWMGPRRLVIECELRAGEPYLLQDVVDGVVIELVVQRRFASRGDRARRAIHPPAG